MPYFLAALTEDALDVKVTDVQRAADFACAVVPDAGGAQTETGVRDVELMAVAPRTALRDGLALIADVAGTQLRLDERRNRAAFHEFGQRQAFAPKRTGHVEDIRLGASRL